jgi:hypothetical protein
LSTPLAFGLRRYPWEAFSRLSAWSRLPTSSFLLDRVLGPIGDVFEPLQITSRNRPELSRTNMKLTRSNLNRNLWSNHGPRIRANRYFILREPPVSRIFSRLRINRVLSWRRRRGGSRRSRTSGGSQEITCNSNSHNNNERECISFWFLDVSVLLLHLCCQRVPKSSL